MMLDSDPTILTHPAPIRSGEDSSGESLIAPPSPDDTDSALAAPPRPAALAADGEDDDEAADAPQATDDDLATGPHMALPSTDSQPTRVFPEKKIDYDPVDDGWGPPGTTIPPPLLGAVPGADDDGDPGTGRIPVSNVEAAPLIVAAPVPPQAARSGGVPSAARELEDATSRLIEVIRKLEYANDRDGVVQIMIAHLAETHQRAGFFVIKRDELSVFAIHPKPSMLPYATLRVDRASTLADVVGTRLPYRGPVPDDASRQFFMAAVGDVPPEVLLVPVAVRERVVGVLFADHRTRHSFDDQLAYASRAAGMALERILKAKRS
jgi:hypothetical protein